MLRKRAAFLSARSPPIPTMPTRSLARRRPKPSPMAEILLWSTRPRPSPTPKREGPTKALSSLPDHARGHVFLGYVKILTKRARRGVAEVNIELALDRNLADAHAFIGLGKIFTGRAEEAEAHIGEALRFEPAGYDGLRLAH